MTYGENGHHLRSDLTTLLRQHRIQQRLGGPGIHTVPESTTAERGRLDRAAQVCGVFAGYDAPDYSVDHKGWRPTPATIDGGPLPGIGGVLQAEHNMLVHLGGFPNALNLRRVMDG